MTACEIPKVSIQALDRAEIDPDQFDHEAHVYAAWLYLCAYPADVAADRFVAALKRLTGKLGVPGKYHDTITRFYLALIAERRLLEPGRDWPSFKAANSDLFAGPGNALARRYSPERLASAEARRAFMLPDRDATGVSRIRTTR